MHPFTDIVLHIALSNNTAFAVAGVVWPCLASHQAVPALPVASLSVFYGPSCRQVLLYAAGTSLPPGESSHPSDCCFCVVSSETVHRPPSGHICTLFCASTRPRFRREGAACSSTLFYPQCRVLSLVRKWLSCQLGLGLAVSDRKPRIIVT